MLRAETWVNFRMHEAAGLSVQVSVLKLSG